MASARGVRFRPPETELPDELVWLLRAAFGPVWQPPARACRSERIADLAIRFDLGARIVARHGADRIRRCLAESAAPLLRARRRAVAVALACERLAGRLAALAAEAATPVVFLKGYALDRLAPGAPGRRPFDDLDLLVAASRAADFADVLAGAGFRSLPVPANEQHLSPVLSPEEIAVDVHYRLRGVSLSGSWTDAEEVLAAGLCSPLAELPGSAAIPTPALLAAHLLAHGIEQHGFRPGEYPLLRMVADLADLVGEPERSPDLPDLEWIAASVSREEAAAVFNLSRSLSAGVLPRPSEDDETGAAVLLSHIVAGTLDPSYRDSLRLHHTAGRVRTALREGHLMEYAARKLQTRGAGAARRGPVWRAVARSLLRPVQAGVRNTRSAIARIARGH